MSKIEPFGYFKADACGWTDCHDDDDGAIPLWDSAALQKWIDPNDKTQAKFLPWIGEKVLFCNAGKVYVGKHTGGAFKAMTPPFALFGTWESRWMPLPEPHQ